MKLLPLALLAALAASADTPGKVIVDDTFADGNSQNQDLANNSVWLFNGRTNNIRTDAPGSVAIDMTPAGGSSEAVWAYFTESGKPLTLLVGDKLTVAVTFSASGFLANGQDIRWGVFDSLGTRNTTNLAGGQNDATFINDTGYGLDFYPSGQGNPFVLGRRAVLSNANVFNNFGDFTTINGSGASDRQTLESDTLYTLTYTIERLTATSTRLTVTATGGALSSLAWSGVETNPQPLSTFDYFAFRVSGTSFARALTFTRVFVHYLPAPPTITAQPQPSALTVQVGATVNMAIAAAGSDLTYQWRKDGKDVGGAKSAAFTIDNAALSDAGSYTAVVTNSGGTAMSDPVALKVSATPVPPPPSITRQPSGVTAIVGDAAMLSLAANGNGLPLFYQWYKNGTLIPGATAAQLTFAKALVADAGSYYATVASSSGSVASAAAALNVVSAMSAISAFPWPGYPSICTDTTLTLDFNQEPRVGKSGRIRVYDSSGRIVDTIDMAANPQTKPIGGTAYVYYPVLITGRRALITLHAQLAYNERFSVTIEPGVIADAAGAPWIGFADQGVWTFRTRAAGPKAGASSMIVGGDDNGDFCTVQGAIDFVPTNNDDPVIIRVRPGVYNEINYVNSAKPFITVRGDDRESTVIQYANNANLNNGNSRAMFGVDAPDFTLDNITLSNTTPRGGSQSEAFRGNNRRILLNRVNLKSYQDTLLLQGLAFVNDSYIEGDVDFMWGIGTVFIQNSELRGVTSGGFYTQIRNVQGQNGNVFVNSKLTSPEGVTGMYLARIDPTVFPFSQVVYIDCAMGPHIIPAGWLLNNATAAPNARFWESGSTTLTGAPLDVTQRAPFSRQLTAAEARQWRDPAFVLGGWVPPTLTVKPAPGGQLAVQWTAPPTRSPLAWIGLHEPGAPDDKFVEAQAIGTGSSGEVVFTVGARKYEARLHLGTAK